MKSVVSYLLISVLFAGEMQAGALKKKFLGDKQSSSNEESKAADSDAVDSSSNSNTSNDAAASPASPASKKNIVGDPIVLRIGRKEFRRSQVLADLRMLPPQLVSSIPPDRLFGMLVDQKSSTHLMVEQAKKAGMEKNSEYIERMERARDELLARMFLMREVAPKAENESSLKARYTKYLVEFKKTKETHAFHIMVASEDEAKKAISELAKGKDFSALAKEKSIAPSKENGGDEGYVPLSALPSPIKEALSALKEGEYTKNSVKSEDGSFHIFKITDSRDASPQKYEEMKDTLKQIIVQEEVAKLVSRLEKQYNVEKFNEDGTPLQK
jgi:peptidyl-prolyl cis-trans isomerase C